MLNQKGFFIIPVVIWYAIAIIGASALGIMAVKSGVLTVKDIENNQAVDVAPTLTPTDIPTISESPTLIPTYAPTQIPEVKAVYVDPDPIVNCNIRPNCGGGIIKMNKSQCEQSTCCLI